MESSPNRISLLLEANLRFLSANLQLSSVVLNTLNNSDALDENQSVLNNLLNWLKSLNQISGLTQGEQVLIEALKDSVRKAKSYDFVIKKEQSIPEMNQVSTSSDQNIETLAKIESIENLSTVFSETEKEDSEKLLDKDEEIEHTESEKSFFYRLNDASDKWDYLTNIKAFISSYEHLMHLLIPNLALELVTELHRYDGQNQLIVNEAISYPSVLVQNLITKFLREAPGSNLFRRIRRIKLDNEVDLSFEQAVNIGERKTIKIVVGTYFNTLSKFLDPENTSQPNMDTLLEQTKAKVRQFSLGPASVEMRLTAVIKHATDSALKDSDEVIKNDNASLKTKVIYLATTQLICDFQNFLLNEPRIVKFLEDLKS